MSLCPFWSNDKENINCFEDCVFSSGGDESCPFKLYLDNNSSSVKDVLDYSFVDDEFTVSQKW